MTLHKKKLLLISFMYELADINSPLDFDKAFESNARETSLFLNSSDGIIPINWLSILFEMVKLPREKAMLISILGMIQGSLNEPIFFHDPTRSDPNRPDYTGPTTSADYKNPTARTVYKRNDEVLTSEVIIPDIITPKPIPKSIRKKNTNTTKVYVRTLKFEKPQFPTEDRFKELINVSLMCSVKNNDYSKYLFKINLLHLIPAATDLKIADNHIILFDMRGHEKLKASIPSNVKFL